MSPASRRWSWLGPHRERIGLSTASTSAYVAAAYLHDLGKMGAYHLTALNVAEYEGHRIAAMKSADLPRT